MTLDQGGAARGRLRRLPVPPGLASAVEGIEVSDGVAGSPPSAQLSGTAEPPAPGWRVIPDVAPHVVIAGLASGHTRVRIVGARSTWIDVDEAGRRFTVGIRLRAGMLPRLLGASAAVLRDRGASLEEVFGAEGRAVDARVSEAGEAREATDVVLAALERRIGGSRPDDRWSALESALREPRTRVAEVARRLGVSTRRLRSVSREAAGLSPKEVQRILRFQRALSAVVEGRGGGTTAHRCGFADQPHMVRDFRSLVGEAPREFRARGFPDSSRVPIRSRRVRPHG